MKSADEILRIVSSETVTTKSGALGSDATIVREIRRPRPVRGDAVPTGLEGDERLEPFAPS
jgi:hypothetical protein